MKKILCFGDSNVYGFNPQNGCRFGKDERWSGILQALCKNKFEIIEAGCNNRTCFKDNPAGTEQTGYKVLPSYLQSKPEFIILALGINDLQAQYKSTQDEIEQGIKNIIKIAKTNCPSSKLILLAPSVIKDCILKSYFGTMFDMTAIELSKQLSEIYKSVANVTGCFFIDLNTIANASDIDGLHYMPEEHSKIAQYLYKFLIDNFTNNP